MRILCICTTQYQLINCINLTLCKYKKDKVDLLLLYNNSKVFDGIRIDKLNCIFNIVNEAYIQSLYSTKIEKYFFLLCKVLSNKPYKMDLKIKYDEVLISGTEMNSKIVAMKYWKRGSTINYFEDGLESYDEILNTEYKYKQDTILKCIFGVRNLDVCNCLYVYAPYLVINNTSKKNIEKILIQKSDFYLKNIYEISKNKCKPFQKKFVFLNVWFSQEDMYNEQLSYINCLKEICSNTYSVKLHPHEKDTDISEKYYIEDCGNFEIANILYDSTNKIYISIISTACLTPKWLADSKPIIIYLFDIFLGKFEIPEWKETKKVISKFIEKENYQNRIFIPRTMEEYRKILNDLNKEVV